MKQGWEIKKLGEVLLKTELVDPTQNPDKEFTYLDVSSVNKETKVIEGATVLLGKNAPSRARKLVKLNDVIFATVRPTHSRVALITEEYDSQICSTGYFVLRPREDINHKYLFYFLLTDHFNQQMEKLQKGASYPAVTDTEVKNIQIKYPKSLPEQQRIVSVLDKCFAAIDKAKANAERNLKNAKELFESYLQGVFEKKGEGWEEKILEEVCEFRNGAAHEQHINEHGKFILVNSKFISAEGEKFKRTNSALAQLFINDIAFVMSDVPNGKALAKCFLVDKNNTYTLNQRIGAIKSEVFVPEFLVYQFNRNKYLLSFNNGENQTNLRKGDILKCPLWVPTKKQQQTIVRQLDALRAETQKLEAVYQKKITDLEELKKSILQKAFAGELETEK
jgi:type I restriction enzyme S subunit